MESGYNLRNPAVKRLMREAQELKDKTEQFSAYPLEDNLFEWHFTIRGPADSDFENGYYHGRIILPPEYPMKPPSIILLTPSGRFETNRKICLSISGFHPESWQPSWSLRTALLGIIGFMPTHGNGAIGSLDYTPEERKLLARKSQDWRCPQCGPIKDLVLPITELSKELTKEAKELGQQINMQGEKQKSTTEEMIVSEVNTANTQTGGAATSTNPPPSSSSPQTAPSTSTSPTAQVAAPNVPQLFSTFQRLQVPVMLPNMPFSFPPLPLVLPQFPFPNPGVPQNTATSNGGQNQQQQIMNPFSSFPFPPPFFMPNFMFNPAQLPFSVPNVVSFPYAPPAYPLAGANAGATRTTLTSQQTSSIQASTTTVATQVSPISSPTTSATTGVQPKEPPSSTQSASVSSTCMASSSSATLPEVLVNQSQTQSSESESSVRPSTSAEPSEQPAESSEQPAEPPEKPAEPSKQPAEISETEVMTKNEDTKPVDPSPSTSSQSLPSSEVMDDGDPVPLASNLRRRTNLSSERSSQSQVNRTNVSGESVSTHRHRYTTRAGILDAMADIFVIVLLFCIFGLLARRVSMFL